MDEMSMTENVGSLILRRIVTEAVNRLMLRMIRRSYGFPGERAPG